MELLKNRLGQINLVHPPQTGVRFGVSIFDVWVDTGGDIELINFDMIASTEVSRDGFVLSGVCFQENPPPPWRVRTMRMFPKL